MELFSEWFKFDESSLRLVDKIQFLSEMERIVTEQI